MKRLLSLNQNEDIRDKIQELEKQQRLEIIANLENNTYLFGEKEEYEKIRTLIQELNVKNKEIIILEEDIDIFDEEQRIRISKHIEDLKRGFLLSDEDGKRIKLKILKIKMDKVAIKLKELYDV